MDPILAEVYSTVLPAAPFVILAYVGIWAALFVYMAMLGHKAKKTRADIAALEEALKNREKTAE